MEGKDHLVISDNHLNWEDIKFKWNYFLQVSEEDIWTGIQTQKFWFTRPMLYQLSCASWLFHSVGKNTFIILEYLPNLVNCMKLINVIFIPLFDDITISCGLFYWVIYKVNQISKYMIDQMPMGCLSGRIPTGFRPG